MTRSNLTSTVLSWSPLAASPPHVAVSKTIKFLSFIFLLALALRVCSLLFFTGSVDWEGAEYARLAQNLREGAGYVGIDMPGKNLMFPPLYPYLIAGLSFIIPSFELAARLISVALGAATVIPVFLLARELYDKRTGYMAAIIVAVHPLLVHFSATANAEATFIFFLTFASYAAIRAIHTPDARYFAAAGALFGLAYLTRIEGAPLAAIAVTVFLCLAILRHRQQNSSRASLARDVGRVFWVPAAFLILASPYINYLHSETGQWRLEGKSPLNIETAVRVVLHDEPKWKVHFEVDRDLNERGIWNRPYVDTIRSFHFELGEMTRYIAAKVQSKTSLWLCGIIFGLIPDGISFGSPLFFGLAVVGLFVSFRSRKEIAGQSLLLAFVVTFLLQILLVVFHNVRFLIVLIPTMAIWAAVGALHVYSWVLKRGIVPVGDNDFMPRRMNMYMLATVSALLAIGHVMALSRPPLSLFNQRSLPIRLAAQSLAAEEHQNRPILVGENTTAFYADAEYCPFPYADEATALRYFEKRKVSYIVLTESTIKQAPYLPSWWMHGIPSTSAVLLREVTTSAGERVRFYRWQQGNAEGPL
jgi:4-amino-4-deoxy-L-arabinose transferase-like glycosyltransferase